MANTANPTMKKVVIYTDGSVSHNPGKVGWAAILRYGGKEKVVTGSCEEITTNMRMEVTALIEALKVLKEPCHVEFYSDSEYLVKGNNEWLDVWRRKLWKTSDKKPVENMDLWKALFELKQVHRVAGNWVRGHDGHPENERCDELAKDAIPGR